MIYYDFLGVMNFLEKFIKTIILFPGGKHT